MKKTLLLCGLALAMAGSMYGQGQVTLINSATTAITVGGTNAPTTLGGGLTVGLYGGPSGALESALTLVGTGSFIAPGRYNGGTVTIPTVAGGANATMQVRAWSGVSYAAALTTAGAFAGKSALWTQTLGGPSPTPPNPITGVPGVNGFALTQTAGPVIPEPSTIALGLLGLGALALFRRRK
jgi:hypothetical protein